MKKPVLLTPIQGHIVLYCKGHYEYENFFEGLKMIWAIRCGYDYQYTSKDSLTYIAMDMFEIIMLCKPERLQSIMENVHRGINESHLMSSNSKDFSPIEALIWQYRIILSNMQIKEKVKKNYKSLIKLPRSKKLLFNRILKGKGKYNDYELITK